MNPIVATTQVIVHFIGLFALFAPGPDHVVHAVLPPIPAEVGVPPHTAAILYPTGSDTYSAGWTTGPQPFHDADNWSYLELEAGDRVSFLTPPSSTLPAVPRELAHLRCPRQNLRSGFKPPTFAKARAVVDIRYGKLTAVKQWAPNEADARIDTELAFDDNGPVVVTVTTKTAATRVLILKPGTSFALAHEATPLFTGVGQIPHDVLHNVAFRAMTATSNPAQNCKCPNSPPAVNPADPNFPLTVHPSHTMNSDCSNSQWP